VFSDALGSLAIGPEQVSRVDRGDGAAFLIDASVGKETLTGPLVERLVAGLHDYASHSNDESQMRWRVSMHFGDVKPDEHGFSGEALNTACRIVDEQVLRDVLDAAVGYDVAVALSRPWYEAVVEKGWVDGRPYRPVGIAVKELTDRIYVRVPGLPHPPLPAGADPPPDQASAGEEPPMRPRRKPSGGGNRVGRIGSVGRDVIVGDQTLGDGDG
jgi:hypothetical protein